MTLFLVDCKVLFVIHTHYEYDYRSIPKSPSVRPLVTVNCDISVDLSVSINFFFNIVLDNLEL